MVFRGRTFYSRLVLLGFMGEDNSGKICSACGAPAVAGRECKECKIRLCPFCMIKLIMTAKSLPLKCPMCQENLT
jgi:hypothetical protein